MAWLNLTMPNQTVKNGLKAKKIKLPQMNFFLEKQLIKFSCTYWPLSFCKILKKFLGPIQNYEDVPFSGPKKPICHKQFFLVQTIIITFIYLLALFNVQNLKNFLQRNQNYEDAPFLAQNGPFAPNFFWKIINITLIFPLAPFIVQNFKKFFQLIQSYEDAQFLGPCEPCFFHSCLSTCLKLKSDINLLVKYWQLKNTEISLAESHFWL